MGVPYSEPKTPPLELNGNYSQNYTVSGELEEGRDAHSESTASHVFKRQLAVASLYEDLC